MRAIDILQEKLRKGLVFLHAKQCAALWRAVAGLLRGQQLWLTALGRNLPGECADKHRIKAIDRLVGSAAIQRAVPKLYSLLACFLLRGIPRPTILVDWTGAGSAFYVLSAKLCFRGRAISIFSRTFPVKRKCSPKAEREFLNELFEVLPPGCRPVLVTDAGFHIEWFDAVLDRGYDFIGRIRGRLKANLERSWVPLSELHALIRARPRDLGRVPLRHTGAREYRLVLSAKRKFKGRKRLTSKGRSRQGGDDHKYRKAAREPWLLATSLTDSSRVVVETYGMRMQIEETFRDLKSRRFGWCLQDVRSKDSARVDVLLLIAAFGAIAMHMVGLAIAQKKLARGFQANTVRSRQVFSSFFLARLTVSRGLDSLVSASMLRAALARLKGRLAFVSLAT